jgi:hypothetical protein
MYFRLPLLLWMSINWLLSHIVDRQSLFKVDQAQVRQLF